MDVPEIHYTRSGDVSIAYQRWGTRGGPVMTWFPFLMGNIEVEWEEPHLVHVYRRLGTFADVISFDKRGTGLSDRIAGAPTFEERVEDARAVLDAAEVEHAYIGGGSEGGPLALLFAAMYPERVDGLILFNSFAALDVDNVPRALVNLGRRHMERRLDRLVAGWGTTDSFGTQFFAPSKVGDAAYERFMQRWERMSCSPEELRRLIDLAREIDIRDVLPTVRARTLIIHCVGDDVIPFLMGRDLARRLTDARFVLVRARDHAWWVTDAADHIVDEMEAFVTGGRRAPPAPSRSLATVLFTDIVASTARAVEIGDDRWRELLDVHDVVSRRLVERWGGSVVKHTGDGVLAVFDAPGRALDCALDLGATLRQRGLEIRIGVHTGEIERRDRDITGVAVHLAHRIMECADAGEVLSSSTVRDLVIGTHHRFGEAGEHDLHGVPDTRALFRVLRPTRP